MLILGDFGNRGFLLFWCGKAVYLIFFTEGGSFGLATKSGVGGWGGVGWGDICRLLILSLIGLLLLFRFLSLRFRDLDFRTTSGIW